MASNTALVLAGLAALQSRDLQTITRIVADDCEWRPALTAGGDLERPVYHGPAGLIRYWEDLHQLFEDVAMEATHIEEPAPGRVLMRARIQARGRASGIPLDVPIWAVYEMRDGKLFRGRGFMSEDEAVTAARG